MESTGKATNDGLKTVDEVAAEDEAEDATLGAMDYIRLTLFGIIS